ncbi:motility associated factor glycosyltransferase family protein [Salibacterium lacus]|uniref:Motility associated factor glycosyltransferase family protein n=1 Tax=Salibacterium lacus TaxID=1898109 RepID=A0ABW5T353_9BACI
MMLIDNINYLRKHFPKTREILKEHEMNLNDSIQVIQAKNGMDILELNKGNQSYPFHSKYAPDREAKTIAAQYKELLHNYDHILFYGTGMGYHINEIMSADPEKEYTIYEPSPTNFYHLLTVKTITDALPVKQLNNIYFDIHDGAVHQNVTHLAQQITGTVLLIELPSYKQNFPELYEKFAASFKQSVKNRKRTLHTNMAYEKRWVVNSWINSPDILKTPNILHDVSKGYFENKPAVIVAAGPSLEEDIEYIRDIKENKRAHVFSVGSAVNSLLYHNIHPDAAISYDPSTLNQRVFEKIVDEEIDSIPLIFGTSIAHEVLQNYPGDNKFHMITNQDTFSPHCLQREDNNKLKVVQDAPTIAVLAMQMLGNLGCNPIILTGQNLGFLDDKRYADSISYSHVSNDVQENEYEEMVDDVYGNKIPTNYAFQESRRQIEHFLLSAMKGFTVINTTKGGASISGAPFQPLDHVLLETLEKNKITDEWCNTAQNNYNRQYTFEKLELLDQEVQNALSLIQRISKTLKNLNQTIENTDVSMLSQIFTQIDKDMKKLRKNEVFQLFLQPMERNKWENYIQTISNVKFEKNSVSKAERILQVVGSFLYACSENMRIVRSVYNTINQELIIN